MTTSPRAHQNASTRTKYHIRGLVALALAAPLAAWGCSPPSEIDRDNRRLVDAILTAITMQNENWLEDDAQLAEERHSAGQLTEAEFEELQSILEIARSGDWQAAEKAGYAFRKKHPFVREGE